MTDRFRVDGAELKAIMDAYTMYQFNGASEEMCDWLCHQVNTFIYTDLNVAQSNLVTSIVKCAVNRHERDLTLDMMEQILMPFNIGVDL